MQQRWYAWECNVCGFSHGIALEFGVGRLKRPRQMVDLAAIELVLMSGVKAITSGEPVGEGSFIRELNGGETPIGGAKLSLTVAAFREIKNRTVLSYGLHC